MKKMMILMISFISIARADAGPEITRWDWRNPKEVTLKIRNREIRYIEESSCRRRGPAPTESLCLFEVEKEALKAISNSHGEIRVRPSGTNTLSFIQATVMSGFCSLDSDTYCVAERKQSQYFSQCSPSSDTVLKLKINGLEVEQAMSPSICNFSDGEKRFGRADYLEYIENRRRVLEKLCRVRDI